MTDAKLSWSYLLLLILLTSLSSSVCQWWSIHPTFPIVGINLAASLCLFVWMPRNICVPLVIGQCLFSIVCVTVANALNVPVNLSTIIHGTGYASQLGLSVFSYVPPAKSLFFVVCALVQVFFLFKIRELPRRKWVGALALAIFAIAMGASFSAQPLTAFSEKNISVTPPERRSLHVRGYLATFVLELATGYPWRMQFQAQPMESAAGTEDLPILPCTNKIVFIQVESLDYEMLTANVNGEYVMPFLHSLKEKGVAIRLNGTKKMASANSDYEVFTGHIASHNILHYEYEKDYSNFLSYLLIQKVASSCFFHGVSENYMNQEETYHRQGVQHSYGLEKMQAEGVRTLPVWSAGIVGDADLLAFAAQKIPASGSFFHFIITLDMHFTDQPEMLCKNIEFPDDPRRVYYSLCRNTDTALASYVNKLPEGTTVAIWGDHRSYTAESSGYIPFVLFVTGQNHTFLHEEGPLLNRSKMYFYLKRNFASLLSQGGNLPQQ